MLTDAAEDISIFIKKKMTFEKIYENPAHMGRASKNFFSEKRLPVIALICRRTHNPPKESIDAAKG